METATFDTHQAVKAIARSGLNDTQAEAIVTTINNAMNQSLATKSDVLAVKVDMEALRADMGVLRADIETFKAEMQGEMLVLKWMVGLIIVVEVLPFLKSLFA
ncbi:MAG: DUF1640 domain-containing protein [Gammaproteobacteria bacterium]|nr:DUF1640 domain-containing protein [Gammaproteobacteria bacterium]